MADEKSLTDEQNQGTPATQETPITPISVKDETALDPVVMMPVEEPPPIEQDQPVTVEPPAADAPPPIAYDPFEVLSARNLKWDNPEHTSITLLVVFRQFKDDLGEIPFTASPSDVEAHGRNVFERAAKGEWGPVAEPAPKTVEQLTAEAQAQINNLTVVANARITALTDEVATLQDAIDMEMATPEEEARLPVAKTELTNWKRYRVFLSRVPTQTGYPQTIDWPVQPA